MLSLVPLWAILWSAIPLTIIPLVAPIVALEANVGIAPLALVLAVVHCGGGLAIGSTTARNVVAALMAPSQARGQT